MSRKTVEVMELTRASLLDGSLEILQSAAAVLSEEMYRIPSWMVEHRFFRVVDDSLARIENRIDYLLGPSEDEVVDSPNQEADSHSVVSLRVTPTISAEIELATKGAISNGGTKKHPTVNCPRPLIKDLRAFVSDIAADKGRSFGVRQSAKKSLELIDQSC